LRAYLDERERTRTRGIERSGGAQLVRKLTSYRMREWAKLNGTTLLMPVSKLRIRSLLREGRELRLNLGSGPSRVPGWTNVDLVGMNPDLHWDLRHGIPFPDGSARAVFLEHVCEHFTVADDLEILAECRRVLAAGGIIRVGVPDFGRYIRSYAGDREFIQELRPGRPTPLLAVAEVAHSHGHRSVWDAETLELLLREAGFTDVRRRDFGDSALQPAPDTEHRAPESVYAEGVRR
jgi:predicted SAM-dependent methyltransferase